MNDAEIDNRVTNSRVSRRTLMLAIAFLGFMVFVALAARVWHQLGPLRFDRRVQARLPSTDAGNRRILKYLSYPGGPLAVGLECAALAALAWWQTRRVRVVTFCAVAPIIVSLVAELVLKPVIERRTASGTGLFFPSGHSTGVTSVATAAWLACVSLWRSRIARIAGAALLSAVVVAVGVSRVMLHAHYASDVIGASFYAVAATLALAAIWLPSR